MENLRIYGKKPFNVVVIHGGPGAAGEMAPVARELASTRGVLEPLQTKASLVGQVEELKSILAKNGDLPAMLVGFSWGAWLSFIVAAKYPVLLSKLILIGAGSFEEKYAGKVQEVRLSRLNSLEREKVELLNEVLVNPLRRGKSLALAQFGELFTKADAYDPIEYDPVIIKPRYDIFHGVWKEALELRSSGQLLALGQNIQCPVTAIHGDYDPHPAEGVKKPLKRILNNFRFILLKNCGHMPWIERQARDKFFEILKAELQIVM